MAPNQLLMRISLTMIACTIMTVTTVAQSVIKGHVVNAETGVPVPGSSVFISNTARGTVSSADGSFYLDKIPDGQQLQLVVSSIGYHTRVYAVNSNQLPMDIKAELLPKVDELDNVTVETYEAQTWEKWGKLFLENFLGYSINAGYCRILNTEDIRFRYYRKTNRLEAFADKPLIIENRALGYRIQYQMEQFEVKFNEKSSFFAGYTLFQELGNKTKNRWVKSRDKAYYGSMKHFLQALYNNSLEEAGFQVRRMKRLPNTEKQRVRGMWKSGMITGNIFDGAIITNTKAAVIDTGKINNVNHPDSLAYYRAVLRQNDFIDQYERQNLTADSIILSHKAPHKTFWFPDYLEVTYKYGLESQEYLDFYREARKPYYQRSLIILADKKSPMYFDRRGNYWPVNNIYTSAWWGFMERICNMLPIEYVPESNNGSKMGASGSE
ncbi:carboxypeptidase-like regulatory domain-containing protein [Nostoc ellipsosporum NOK]|nr:carboxypeptidase-like regulatory domain-containing protein [Nostoc ellipsosporum NOK]